MLEKKKLHESVLHIKTEKKSSYRKPASGNEWFLNLTKILYSTINTI